MQLIHFFNYCPTRIYSWGKYHYAKVLPWRLMQCNWQNFIKGLNLLPTEMSSKTLIHFKSSRYLVCMTIKSIQLKISEDNSEVTKPRLRFCIYKSAQTALQTSLLLNDSQNKNLPSKSLKILNISLCFAENAFQVFPKVVASYSTTHTGRKNMKYLMREGR